MQSASEGGEIDSMTRYRLEENFPMTAPEDGNDREQIIADDHPQGVTNEQVEMAWYQCPLQLMAMLSNYSTSYNVVNISMVIPILQHTIEGTTSQDVATTASSLLAGMIVGQLGGGYLGDTHLGRLGALQLVMGLQVVASIGSSLLWTGSNGQAFFVWMAIFRFFLGVGAGGVYPLAAVLSAEQGHNNNQLTDTSEDGPKQVQRVVLTFSTQGLGFITVPLVSVFLSCITSNLNIIWRLILALGSVPGIILLVAQYRIHRQSSHQALPIGEEGGDDHGRRTDADIQHSEEVIHPEDSEEILLREVLRLERELRPRIGRWEAIRREPNLVQKLLGTAGTWFLFDVLFYGNSLFTPVVIAAAFGSKTGGDPIHDIRDTAIKSLFVYSIALPGYAVAGFVMGKRICGVHQTPKFVMLQGFAAMGTLYLALGTNWSALKHIPEVLVLLYAFTFFFANYGPNTTTFILPSMVFSPECRSTLNGVSAAAGKLGALTGATLFEPLVADIGDANVMLICAGIAFLSFIMTCSFVKAHSFSHLTDA